MEENSGNRKDMKQIIDELLKDSEVITEDPVYVRHQVVDGSITFMNVPFLTYDDPADPDWYCLTHSAEKVLVAYLRHPLVDTTGEPVTLDYDTVERFVYETGLLT